MQKRNEPDYLKRVQYYSAHSHIQQLKQGLTHINLLPIIVISLIKTKIFDKDVPYISFHKTIETSTNKQYLFDLSYVFIELGKFKAEKLSNIADEWLHLFKCAETEQNPPSNIHSTKVLDAYHCIEMHGLSPEEYDLYIRTKLAEDAEDIAMTKNFTEGMEQGEIKGRVEGKIEGIEQGKVEIAKKMLAKNKTMEEIIELTELSYEQIEKLKT
jgi:predicted transposase/invertase (TIGR01784 family)